MEASTLDWLITLLALHVIALAVVIHLFKGAPCWMRRVSVGLLVLAFAIFCAAYIAALARQYQWWWGLLLLGFAIEHMAVLLELFRVWWQTEEKKWTSSLRSSI